MSKFFKGAVSSSDSSGSESSDDEPFVPIKRPQAAFAYPSDSDDEGQKRVVKAQKDRKFEELKDLIKQAKNSRNIRDMSKLLSTFEELCKVFEKTKVVLTRQSMSTPRFYVRILVELEDFVNEQWDDKEARKTMSKANSKGLTALRQKIRKYNKDMEMEVNAYRAEPDPVGYSSADNQDEEDEQEEPENEEEVVKSKSHSDLKDSDEWSSDSNASSDSDSDLDLEGKQMEDLRKFFLKKEFKEGGEAEGTKEREAKEKIEENENDDAWVAVPTKEEKMRQLFDAKTEINHEIVINKLQEVIAARGRKSTNPKHYVRSLQELFRIADEHKLGAGVLVKILFSIISALFELNARISDCMDYSSWNKTLGATNSLIDMLNEYPDIILSVGINEDDENIQDATKPYTVHGSVLMSVHRLDTELTKILQNADCHSTDYIEKLKGEKDLCALIDKLMDYVNARLDKGVFLEEEVCKLYMLRIEHLYYKYEVEDSLEQGQESSIAIMERLCKEVYVRDDTKRLRQRAMLCQIYHLALHDKWHQARDLMLMSHLQAIVDHSDVSTQILYNRTICQLGLCAFRHSFIKEAHQGLSEIQNTQRAERTAGTGIAMRQQERTAEQEKLERARQIPYHMHINVELMECVYLICSMLLEIPHMASQEYELRRRLLSRSFHYQLKQSEKSSLIGPPENTREHVVAASRAMLNGDWKKCRDYIVNDKMDAKVWNLFRNSEKVKEMVIHRIQEESLRTYLLMYSTVYTTVSLETLSQLFELDKSTVHSVISKMIISEELSASLDEPTDCLIMHRVEPSRLQLLALHLTDKLTQLADSNEQILEPRAGRSYTGPGAWYGLRQERAIAEQQQRSNRMTYQDSSNKNRWNANLQHRRRMEQRVRY
ncbi:Eukaryotic translation initiation factor 3 subunit 8 [Dirofilaria immitis]|nr:Eukaryotic translation initiation factor 3 subunit 8 [Dirofilaria immitis]